MALVLIVIDEPDILLLVQRELETAGHQTVLAADADTARERLAGRPIDIVIVDVMMPVRDGWAVLEALGGGGDGARIPAIVLSGRAHPSELARATQMGAVTTLAAPITAQGVAQALSVALPSGVATAGGAVERPHAVGA